MKTRGLMLAAAALITAAAGSASGALISVSGSFSGSFGSAGALGINSSNTDHITGSLAGGSYTGDVIANNTGGGNLLLTLTNLTIISNQSGPLTLTVDITQDYTIGNFLSWTGSHQFNGDVTFTNAGQSANVSATSTHESTVLPPLAQNEVAAGPGTVVLNRGQGPATNVNPFSNPYTIHAVYTFVLNRGASGTVTLNFPNSGVDQASAIAAVPLPAAGVAGMAGLLGVMGVRRRR